MSSPNDDGPNFSMFFHYLTQDAEAQKVAWAYGPGYLSHKIVYFALKADEILGTSDEIKTLNEYKALLQDAG